MTVSTIMSVMTPINKAEKAKDPPYLNQDWPDYLWGNIPASKVTFKEFQ